MTHFACGGIEICLSSLKSKINGTLERKAFPPDIFLLRKTPNRNSGSLKGHPPTAYPVRLVSLPPYLSRTVPLRELALLQSSCLLILGNPTRLQRTRRQEGQFQE